jgi:nicotinamidase-related amidase
VTVDPTKTALVLVDFQNFFLSPVLGRPKDSKGITACQQVAKYAIPACRKAGIRIVYLNWGLTDEDIEKMPPGTRRAFGFDVVEDDEEGDMGDKKLPPKPAFGKDPKMYKGLGSEIGTLQLEDGTKVEGGRLLMRDQWNSDLFPVLEALRKPEDVWIHKNR